MGFIWLVVIFVLAVKVVRANNCWLTSVSIYYAVGPSVVNITQSKSINIMNEVLRHGKSQLSCSGLTLTLLNVTTASPGNQYSIKGFFGVIYGNMGLSQKSAAKSCLQNAAIFNQIGLRPDYYTSPLKGPSYFASRAFITNFQDTNCSLKAVNESVPSNDAFGITLRPATKKSSAVPQATTQATLPPTPSTFSATTLSPIPIIANDGQVFTYKKGETAVLFCIGSSEKKPDEIEWTSKLPSSAEQHRRDTTKTRSIYMTLKDVKETDAGIYKCRTSMKGDVKAGEGGVTLIVIVPVEVELNATLLNETFSDDLKNNMTPKYKKLKTKFEKALSVLYVNLAGFVRVEVIGFTEGSVKVKFRVIVRVRIGEAKELNKPTRTKVDVTRRIIQKVKTSGGNIGRGMFIKQNSITSDAPPPAPRNLTVTEVHQNMAHLKWLQPQDAYVFSIQSYTIKLKKFEHEWQEKVTTQHIQLNSRIEELEDDTSYIVKVFARGNGGEGLDSEQREFKTKEVEINLTWLWVCVCIAIFLVFGILIPVAVYRYKKKKRLKDHRYEAANGNVVNGDEQTNTSIPSSNDPQTVPFYSFRNNAFALNSMDFESLGLTPDKWWEIPRRFLTLGDTLGAGQFGMVKKGLLELENGPMTCAVKMLKNSAGEEERRDLMSELEIMAGVGSHENLVNLIGACTSVEGPTLIALEFAEGGSLLSYIKLNVMSVGDGDEASSLSDQEKLEIALDIAKGMQHLEHVKCIHRDLAARNVLLTSDHRAKIADFGLSRDVYERGFYQKRSKGKLPARWMSPEAIQEMMFTTKSDVWSYGVVLWEIESGGKLPYKGLRMLELIDYLKKGWRLARPIRCMQGVFNLMQQCWHMNPNERPTFDNICSNMEELLSQTEV